MFPVFVTCTALFGNSIFNMTPKIDNKLSAALAHRNLNLAKVKNELNKILKKCLEYLTDTFSPT